MAFIEPEIHESNLRRQVQWGISPSDGSSGISFNRDFATCSIYEGMDRFGCEIGSVIVGGCRWQGFSYTLKERFSTITFMPSMR
jgi:hypothetical protein